MITKKNTKHTQNFTFPPRKISSTEDTGNNSLTKHLTRVRELKRTLKITHKQLEIDTYC